MYFWKNEFEMVDAVWTVWKPTQSAFKNRSCFSTVLPAKYKPKTNKIMILYEIDLALSEIFNWTNEWFMTF